MTELFFVGETAAGPRGCLMQADRRLVAFRHIDYMSGDDSLSAHNPSRGYGLLAMPLEVSCKYCSYVYVAKFE